MAAGPISGVPEVGCRPHAGRDYTFCHTTSALDRYTFTALGLIYLSFLACLSATVILARAEHRRFLPFAAGLLAVAALLVAADTLDAHAERKAARIEAAGLHAPHCDYTPQTYAATPGWFSLVF